MAPYYVGGEGAAAGRVHTYHNGGNVIVVDGALQRLREVRGVDIVVRTAAVHNHAVGIYYGHLGRRDVRHVGHDVGGVVAQRYELGIGDAVVGLHRLHHLVNIHRPVDEVVLLGLLRQQHLKIVGQTVQLRLVYSACRRDSLRQHTPQIVGQHLRLLAVLGRHVGADEWLDGALVLAGRGSQDRHLDPQLVDQALEEECAHREARPLEAAFGLDVDAVGGRRQIVSPLRVDRVVGHDELAARGLEFEDRLPQLLDGGDLGRAHAREVDIYAAYAVVGRGGLDGTQRVIECELPAHAHGREVELRHGVARGCVHKVLTQVYAQHGLLGHGCHLRLHEAREARKEPQPEQSRQHAARNYGQQRGKEDLAEREMSLLFSDLFHTVMLFITLILGRMICCKDSESREQRQIF